MKTGYAVGDAMTRSPVSVQKDATLQQCTSLMDENDVGSLIVKSGNEMQGMITAQDIISSIASSKDVNSTKVQDVMSKAITRISPDMDIFDALLKMAELDVRQLPVENRGELVGLLTMKDVLKIEPMLFEIIASKLEIREEEKKPIYRSGSCEICGQDAEDLMRQRGKLICGNCRLF